MEQIPNNDSSTGSKEATRAPWKRVFVFFGAFVALMLVGAGAYFGIRYYRYRNGYLLPMEKYNAYMDIFRNDTYGGATPEETLKLFVAALREGDVEKASLYFMPDDRGSREKWVKALTSDKEKGNLDEIIDVVSRAKYAGDIMGVSMIYEVRGSNGDVEASIDLVKGVNVWKIESL
ncbi:MAG: hypothetical protein Q7R85_04295 [bacterium]|nr:hypothetical protein [bacterium]